MTKQERPEIKALITKAVDDCIAEKRAEMERAQDFQPEMRFIYEDGRCAIQPVPGQLVESGSAKRALFKAGAAFCRVTGAAGMLFVSDAWTLDQDEAQIERISKDKAYREEFLKAAHEAGCVAAAKAGFGRLTEMIQCLGQTRLYVQMKAVRYDRLAADGIIPPTSVAARAEIPDYTIRWGAETSMSSDDDEAEIDGRMLTLYEGKRGRAELGGTGDATRPKEERL